MLIRADLNIWDVVVICMSHNIEAVDRTLKALMCNIISFGGKAIMFVEDF